MAGGWSSEKPRARTSVEMAGGCSSENPRARTTHVSRCPDSVFPADNLHQDIVEGHMLETASHSAARGHNVKMSKTRALSTHTLLPVKPHTVSPLRKTQHVPRRTLFGRGGELLHRSKREQQSDRTDGHMIAPLGDHKLPGSAQSSPNPTYELNRPAWTARELTTVDDFRRLNAHSSGHIQRLGTNAAIWRR